MSVYKPGPNLERSGAGSASFFWVSFFWAKPGVVTRRRSATENLNILPVSSDLVIRFHLWGRGFSLSGTRSLAAREFSLGIEALERLVAREPLRRVHECVFGVLALESEPVDPRL